MKVTSNNITELKQNEIFVFGSNLAGVHGAGAAYLAHRKFGAEWGVGEGITGNCYALPTKNKHIETLSLAEIKKSVGLLYHTAKVLSKLHFLITEVGCGLAGYTPNDIAPLFSDFLSLENVSLPKRFIIERVNELLK